MNVSEVPLRKYSRQSCSVDSMGAQIRLTPATNKNPEDLDSPDAVTDVEESLVRSFQNEEQDATKKENFRKFMGLATTSNDEQSAAPAEINLDMLQDLVARILMNEETSQWSTNNWVARIATELHIAEVSPDLKHTIKSTVTNQVAPLISQQSQEEIEMGSESQLDAVADYETQTSSSPTLLSSAQVSSDDLRSVIQSFMSNSSVLWTVKAWVENVEREMRIDPLSREQKNILKQLVMEEANVIMSQTQDELATGMQIDDFMNSSGVGAEGGDLTVPEQFNFSDEEGSFIQHSDSGRDSIDNADDSDRRNGDDFEDDFLKELSDEDDDDLAAFAGGASSRHKRTNPNARSRAMERKRRRKAPKPSQHSVSDALPQATNEIDIETKIRAAGTEELEVFVLNCYH